MNWLNPIIGIFKDFFQGRREVKKLELEQKMEYIKSETERIRANTISDNDSDFQTIKDKKYTYKDDVLTYVFLFPVISATIVPIIQAYQNSNFALLNHYIKDSYDTLNLLPTWYKYVLFAIVIDVLGFRSFAREFISDLYKNYKNKK